MYDPSQLCEAFFEGIVLFALLWGRRKRFPLQEFALPLYLMGYCTVRFFIEFTRQPDPQLGLVPGPLSMGQLAMVLGGAGLMAARGISARKAGR